MFIIFLGGGGSGRGHEQELNICKEYYVFFKTIVHISIKKNTLLFKGMTVVLRGHGEYSSVLFEDYHDVTPFVVFQNVFIPFGITTLY